jgi:hypothetical protein
VVHAALMRRRVMFVDIVDTQTAEGGAGRRSTVPRMPADFAL